MAQGIQDEAERFTRPPGEDETGTVQSNKRVMLSAERHDEIEITEVHTRLETGEVPDLVTVLRKTEPYFGPQLLLEAEGQNYSLTAPGPDTQLLLWEAKLDEEGCRTGWEKLAEVSAEFTYTGEIPDHCPQCGGLLTSLEHEREAKFGLCSRSE